MRTLLFTSPRTAQEQMARRVARVHASVLNANVDDARIVSDLIAEGCDVCEASRVTIPL